MGMGRGVEARPLLQESRPRALRREHQAAPPAPSSVLDCMGAPLPELRDKEAGEIQVPVCSLGLPAGLGASP